MLPSFHPPIVEVLEHEACVGLLGPQSGQRVALTFWFKASDLKPEDAQAKVPPEHAVSVLLQSQPKCVDTCLALGVFLNVRQPEQNPGLMLK